MSEELTRRAFGQAVAAAAIGVPSMLQSGGGSQPREAPDLFYLSATELVGLMRRKQVSAREVMARASRTDRAGQPEGERHRHAGGGASDGRSGARRRGSGARRAVGVLHGLPVAHKDLVDTAGIRTTRGSPFYRDHVPDT